ncbi:uncharacterized protein [Rutidosis leptorrhynchoides]|uniref:uncharacterized protein n=1 Tax=Rutidosis leptorrhynchoides TaxID=125765 RepID=UPI003A9996B8
MGNILNSHAEYSWQCALEDDMEFSVSGTRLFIDDRISPTNQISIRWLKCIPRKIYTFLWRVTLDRLPTRINLSSRGVDVEGVTLDRLPTRINLSSRGVDVVDIGCAVCSLGIESSDHVLFGCDLAMELWRKCRKWVNIPMPMFTKWSAFVDWFDGFMGGVQVKL